MTYSKKIMIWGITIFLIFASLSCQIGEKNQSKSDTSIMSVSEIPFKFQYPPQLPTTQNKLKREIESGWELVSFPTNKVKETSEIISSWPEIHSIWKWDIKLESWRTYPQLGRFSELNYITPDEGYWIKVREDFELKGEGVKNTYSFFKGWNLVGYSHSSPSISIPDFLEQGDYWANNCSDEEPVLSVWAWNDNNWKIYFPGDTEELHPNLDSFNDLHNTDLGFLKTLEPGMGFWINAALGNGPPSVEDSCFSDDEINQGETTANSFVPSLPDFSTDILQGYDTCSGLSDDLEKAAQYLANQIIQQQKRNLFYYDNYYESSGGSWGIEVDVGYDDVSAPEETGEVKQGDGNSTESNADPAGYETNVQVQGVDEGDIVKSDGKYIYIAYGNEIIINDLLGNILDRKTIPSVDKTSSGQIVKDDLNDSANFGSSNHRIKALLFEAGIVIAVSDYYYYEENSISSNMNLITKYEVSEEGKLTLIESVSNYGSYKTSRYIEGNAYIVSSIFLNTYQITWPLYYHNFQKYMLSDQVWEKLSEILSISIMEKLQGLRNKEFNSYYNLNSAIKTALTGYDYYLIRLITEYAEKSLTAEDYEILAYQKAQEIIPEWQEKIMMSIFADENGSISQDACKNIARISNMRQGSDEEENENLEMYGDNGVLNAFARIYSFNLSEGLSSIKQSGAFLPVSYNLITYANEDTIILSGNGWNRFGPWQWRATTFLIGFSINSEEVKPVAVGAIPGSILNQFSIDYHNEHLRVASSIDAEWGLDEDTGRWTRQTPSEGRITILKFNDNQMVKTGEITKLGEGEKIYSTRFLGDRGFVVTFRQIDPFYTLDLSDPINPRIVGELKIPGFSNYLHPVGDDYILAIGRDADMNTGRWGGLQIALFDVSDLENPTQLHKHVVEGWSSSEASYDHKAFRYLNSQQALILPLNYRKYLEGWDNYEAFDGFKIFKISKEDGIIPKGSISHSNEYCYYRSNSSPRSLVFNDQIVTIKGSKIKSHVFSQLLENEGESEKQWEINLLNSEYDTCYYWFF